MNSTIITYFLMTSCALSCAMEIELNDLSRHKSVPHDYSLLTDNTLSTIHAQQSTLCEQEYIFSQAVAQVQKDSDTILSSLLLSNIKEQFCSMSHIYKRALLHIMSTRLLLLSCVAICLPAEIVKNHICYFLLDGNADAVEEFCQRPLACMFHRYNRIRTGLADDAMPIGPLYTAHEAECDLVFRMKAPWYYDIPIMTQQEKRDLMAVPVRVKSAYLAGKTIMVVSDENQPCSVRLVARNALISGLSAASIFGLFETVFGIVSCMVGANIACHPGALAVTSTCAVCSGCSVCGIGTVFSWYDYVYRRAERVVL